MKLIISKDKISKASNVRKVDPIYIQVAEELAKIDILQHVKIYNGRIQASNILSSNGKKEPITEIGKDNVVGVELLIDVPKSGACSIRRNSNRKRMKEYCARYIRKKSP